MASASSKSARNLFADSKKRLADRVLVNINNLGSIARQVQRGAKASESLATAARSTAGAEHAMENSFNNLQKMQVLMAQMNLQHEQISSNITAVTDVMILAQDMER